jgi:hypothetical protein
MRLSSRGHVGGTVSNRNTIELLCKFTCTSITNTNKREFYKKEIVLIRDRTH